MASSRPEPIAIVGSGCRFPGGASSPSKLWNLIREPHDVLCEIPPERFNTTGFFHPDGTHHATTNVRHSYLLQENIKVFDATFFNISPNEADSIDPQQRLLLETVYEAMEAGGHTMEALRGSDTAVYVGTMNADYGDSLMRDIDTAPTYSATGTSRAIISNRVSYFFDWHGPSMTIDTACSSSLIAVHQGVQALRSGESRVAVACGTQVIIGPEVFVFESNLKMLSPTGRSRMWDSEADGYARGEGVAAVVLKRLSDAVADNDNIECVIRETGTNQDGFSSGITVPSADAQAMLIRQTYRRSGLDPVNNPHDRPQFFEAHGTGTKAGDPKEASAIHRCLGVHAGDGAEPLYVGSIKTVIGHTEGAAGLAGLLKASAIIQKGIIPPNRLFDKLNPEIEPFYKGLKVPTSLLPWPQLPEGVPRRVSVNSFGFGGSNAHAIVEEYRPAEGGPSFTATKGDTSAGVGAVAPRPSFTPFVFSAASEVSLGGQLRAYSEHLGANPGINPADLSWTLQSRRSQLPFKVSFSAATIGELKARIDERLASLEQQTPATAIGIRSLFANKGAPGILGVFTGQGAQWPAMGAELVRSSEFVRERVRELGLFLTSLPEPDRPEWDLEREMLAGADVSRVAEAAISQPLCTAIQIILVDLLRSAGVRFSAVVGHSSGEIGAAYAAGFLSDKDALRVAYYRGVYARLAGSATCADDEKKGAMMAVGTSWEDAQDLVGLRAFRGRLALAAHNSSASVTLSGDADAIAHAKKVFDEEKKFARVLKVDTAYHSHHMLPCGDPYVRALKACGVRALDPRPEGGKEACSWFSSVFPEGSPVEASEALEGEYWRDNMQNTVLFADAVKNAVATNGQIACAIEVGPHPALKGPATENIGEVRSSPLPYAGVLSRGRSDLDSFSDGLGFVWSHLGAAGGVDFRSYEKLVSASGSASASAPECNPRLVVGLPSYKWNHSRHHWHESRRSRKFLGRQKPFHELLGVQCADSTDRDLRWQNVLKVSEIPWMEGHQLQGQTVFPAAGYCAMAIEAAKSLAGDREVEVLELRDLSIPRAITFEDDSTAGVETLVTLTDITTSAGGDTVANFVLYSCPVSTGAGTSAGASAEQDLEVTASGSVKIVFGRPSADALSSTALRNSDMSDVDATLFYDSLSKLGYDYNGPFRSMTSLKRRYNQSSVEVDSYVYEQEQRKSIYAFTRYLVHPTWLDVAFQASILAFSAPGDERLWSIHVPTAIRRIRVSPAVCGSVPAHSPTKLPVCSSLADSSEGFSASIDVFGQDGSSTMVQVEDLKISPFAPATAADDRRIFSYTELDVDSPDGASVVQGDAPTAAEADLALLCERVSFYFVRKWKAEITDEDWAKGQPHHAALRDYMDHILDLVSEGRHPTIKGEWASDTSEDISAMASRYPGNVDIALLRVVGENIPAAVRGDTSILEHMLRDNLLDDQYKQGLALSAYNVFLARMMGQLLHRYPHARILEIGAGTGGATQAVLRSIGHRMSSYTYTDISAGFFAAAVKAFEEWGDKMVFETLDIERPPTSQGYQQHSYDIVIASNVLHATSSMQRTLEHTRQLLRPGGYLVLLEITNNDLIRGGNMMGGMAGWWLGVDDGRRYTPTMTPAQWHASLRSAGFGGVDAITPAVDPVAWPFSVMASQAVDDRVNFLRKPLAGGPLAASVHLDSVVVLGGTSLDGARVATEVAESLAHCSSKMTVLTGLPTEEEAADLPLMSTIINLVDIDGSPIFKDVTTEKMEGLKRVYEIAGTLVWITRNAQLDEPYHMASIAFSRAMDREAPHVNMSHLDVPDLGPGVARAIAEHVLRQCALGEWDGRGGYGGERRGELLWSRERECYLDHGGQIRVPRLISNVGQNARINSSRRSIVATAPLKDCPNVVLSVSDSALSSRSRHSLALVEQTLLPGAAAAAPPSRGGCGGGVVKLVASTVQALLVAADTFLVVGIGKDANRNSVVTLSNTNSPEIIPVARVPLDSTTQPLDRLLVDIATDLAAVSLIQTISPEGSILLVHVSVEDRFLASSLARRAAAVKSVGVMFTYDARAFVDASVPDSWIGLNPRAPRHVIREVVRRVRPTHFLDLTTTSTTAPSELSVSISRVLPSDIRRVHGSELSRNQPPWSPSRSGAECLVARLQSSVSAVVAKDREVNNAAVQDLIIQLDQVHDPYLKIHASSVLRWSRDSGENDDVKVRVQVRQVDPKRLFSKDKSYLLVGLTGKIGQSLCEWMVANGAGCVWLTSRSPKIDPGWPDSLYKAYDNSTVRIASLDVTDKSAVERLVAEIRATCPPIAGVANGAMVLRDCLFSEMPIDDLRAVLGPKIDGSRNLDEVFHNDPLDFFVLFSSAVQVMGNPGQSNYAAANGYLTTLARQRRRRGLAASAFDIGRVAGIGYIETAGQNVLDQLIRFGLRAISETDFRQAFAETILSGYPMPGDTEGSNIPAAVITTGIREFQQNEEVAGPWFDNPLFSHCVIESSGFRSSDAETSKKTGLSVAKQLVGAASKEEALEILQQSFSAKLKVMLQISDQQVDPEASLVELGVDSLVAVEVRSWFLKELQVDVPVLKIMGGATLAELCQRAIERLPASSVPGGKLGEAAVKKDPEIDLAPPRLSSISHATSTAVAKSSSPSNGFAGSASQPSPVSAPSAAESTPDNELSRMGSPDSASVTTPDTATPLLAPSVAAAAEAQPPERKFLRTELISFGQSRFWFLQLLLKDPTASNVSLYFKVTGTLRVSDLERAVRVVTSRHEALRTAFVEDETHLDQAYQKVLDTSPVRLEVRSAGSAAEANAVYCDLRRHAFDLGSGDLIRLILVSISPTLHYIVFHHHHIAMDGVSFQVLVRDLGKAYESQSLGPPPRQFPDFSRAQRTAYETGELSEELDYWRTIFPAGQEPPVLPLLPMASTSSRVAMDDFSVHQVVGRIEPELMARIKAVSRSKRSTPFHFYLAAFKTMLFKFAATDDLTIGIADANRTDSDVMGSIGFFLNLLTLRFRRIAAQPFSDAAAEARDTAYSALGNSRLPFDVLLEELNIARSSTHSPFFQAFFDYRQGAQEKFSWGDTHFEIEEAHVGRTAYDMTLDVTDNARDSLVIFRVQRALYDSTAAALLLETYIHLLDTLSNDPTLTLESTPVFSKAQLSRATEIGRGPKLVSAWPSTLPLRIDEVAQRVPGDVALKDGHGASLNYSDLVGRVESIAEDLGRAGVGPGGPVPVFQDAAADWVCSMLAIMRVGGIYVPLDLRNPLPRLAAVVADCKPVAILVDSTTQSDVEQINVADVPVIDVSCLASKPSKPVPNVSKADTPAAILYTSGSTGTPKGIVVTHGGLRNEIEGYTSTWKLGAERTLQQSAFTFNHSMDQIYTGLANGGMVYIVPWSERGDPLQVTRIVKEESITYTKATPAEYSLWLQYGGDNLRVADTWRAAFGGGEPMDRALIRGFADLALPQLRLHNSYGPTEISISSTKMEVDYRNPAAMEVDGGRIPCGFSLPNYHAYIVDEKLRPLPAGMAGELCISGAGVSLGYLGNKELTDEHFVRNPFATAEDAANGWTRMYRTGDFCHLRHDGALVFHGRMAGDTQVKIRGLRIELSDIESNIVATSEGVLKDAVVTLREGDPDFLVAHVVFAQQPLGNAETYLANLLSRLPVPQYMVPVVALPLERLPLTNHSKVDRRAIKELPLSQRVQGGGGSREENDEYEELTETMVRLRGVWLDVLKNRHVEFDISPSSSFFLVGGNSLLAIRLQSRIRDVFDVTIRLVDLLHTNKLGEMARKIDESVRVDRIDWDHETKPPSLPDFLLTDSIEGTAERKEKKTVLVTGSTGFLAKYVLSQLLANAAIDAIHHVAVRDPSKLTHTATTTSNSPKVVIHAGDLAAPLLGLSEAEFSHLASTVDVIIHLGAARSFWDNYHVLRTANVRATAELVKIAAPRRTHIHYISTFGVLPQDGDHLASPGSAAANVPASDGSSNGYMTTKWASERILERSADELGVPSTIYRFLPSSQTAEATPRDVLDEFVRFVDIVGATPDMPGWDGRIDMIPAAQAASWLLGSVFDTANDENGRVKFAHSKSTASVNIEDLRDAMEEERSRHGREIATMPGLRWLGRIKQFGFDYLFTSQQATIQETGANGESSEFESRR